MTRALTKHILSVFVFIMCVSVLFACTPKEQSEGQSVSIAITDIERGIESGVLYSEEQSVSIVITDIERGIENGVLYIGGYSISDKKEFRFQFKNDAAPGDEPLIANVVEITYKINHENEEAIPIESIHVISNGAFSGRMVFIKGLGACFIRSVNGVYELNEIKGLHTAYFNNLKPADSVVVYGDIISDKTDAIAIRASHLEVSNDNDNEARAWNEAELAILEKYDMVDSYAQAQYETPLGDRNSSDSEIFNLLALTDAKIKEEYGINHLDRYSVIIREHASKPQKTVRYELYLGGYCTHEVYSVVVDHNGTILNCYEANAGEYSRFLPYFTIEKLQDAEEKLKNKMSAYGNASHMYLEINSEGQLCLSFETIVNIYPPKVQMVEGEIISSGCNIDHKHVFESEVVCDMNP